MMNETVVVVIILLACLTPTVNMLVHRHWEYVVIGAGPAGLQMGYFLQRAHRDYIIFERANVSGKHLSNDLCCIVTLISNSVVSMS